MFLLIPAVVILAVATALSRSLDPLASIRFRAKGLAAAALMMQLLMVSLSRADVSLPLNAVAVMLGISNVLLLSFTACNLRVPGMILVGAGILLNFCVMSANRGYMPVTVEALYSSGQHLCFIDEETTWPVTRGKSVILAREDTHLWQLSDVLVPPSEIPLRSPMSVGDLVIAGGLVVVVAHPTVARQRRGLRCRPGPPQHSMR